MILAFAVPTVALNTARDLGGRFACGIVYGRQCFPMQYSALAALTNILGTFIGAGIQIFILSDHRRHLVRAVDLSCSARAQRKRRSTCRLVTPSVIRRPQKASDRLARCDMMRRTRRSMGRTARPRMSEQVSELVNGTSLQAYLSCLDSISRCCRTQEACCRVGDESETAHSFEPGPPSRGPRLRSDEMSSHMLGKAFYAFTDTCNNVKTAAGSCPSSGEFAIPILNKTTGWWSVNSATMYEK